MLYMGSKTHGSDRSWVLTGWEELWGKGAGRPLRQCAECETAVNPGSGGGQQQP